MTVSIADKIKSFLIENGFGDLLNNVNPYSCHSDGLPNYEFSMRTENNVISDGLTKIVISADHIYVVCIPFPLNFRSWRVHKSFKYETKGALLSILQVEARKKKGCWE